MTPNQGGINFTAVAQTIFDGLLVMVGWLQYRTYNRQRKIMATQRDIAATQTDILSKQKEISRQGHIATHRPRLSVRNVVIRAETRFWPGERPPGMPDFPIGEMLTGQLYVVNRGGYEAQITDALVMIYRTDKPTLPMERPYEGQNGNVGRMSNPLLAGQSFPIPILSPDPVSSDVRSRIIEGTDGKHLYVMGWIEYQDGSYDIRTDTQLTRRTAFCRLYNPETQRFTPVSDPDYEHEE